MLFKRYCYLLLSFCFVIAAFPVSVVAIALLLHYYCSASATGLLCCYAFALLLLSYCGGITSGIRAAVLLLWYQYAIVMVSIVFQ